MINRRFVNIVLIILLQIVWPFEASSQVARFKNFFTDEGYKGVGNPHMVQDSLGYLWIKAGNALYRFDGYEFKEYRNNAKDSLMLPESGGYMAIDPSGNLMIHTDVLRFFDRELDGFI